MSWLFKFAFYIGFSIDCLTLLFGFYLIVEDMTRFAGYPKNGGSGLVLATLGFIAWLGGSYFLFTHGQKSLATILVWIPAVPVLLYALFILMFIILKPDMK